MECNLNWYTLLNLEVDKMLICLERHLWISRSYA